VRTETYEFFSDGIRLDGVLRSPDEANSSGRRPAVIVCSGLHGVKEWVPARWWPHIVEVGYHCFAFDYRGFGTSDGTRGRVIPEEEIRDALSAVTFLRTFDTIDPDRIALIGWGLGGGIAIEATARDARIAAVCCANGAGDYGRTVRDAVPYPIWLDWQDRLEADRRQRVLTGTSELVDYREITNPESPEAYATHDQFYKDLRLIGAVPIQRFTLESCDAYVSFRPERVVANIAPRPILFVHGRRNYFMPIDEAYRLYDLAKEPKRLYVVPNGKHLEIIDPDSPDYLPTMRVVMDWLRSVLS
jgi:hypothetical protein